MRILSGKYARRMIGVVGRTRPLLTRIRQYIFDILGGVDGLVVLDLCAGSGSFGLECLSRGAGFTYFFEENLDTAHNLMQTLSTWSISNAKVVVKNVQYLPQAMVQVDLIFLDPPFGHKYTEQVMDRIAKKGWSSPKARLVVRSDYRLEHVSPYWLLVRHEQIGISHVHLYRVRDSGSVWDEVSALELLCQPDYEEG